MVLAADLLVILLKSKGGRDLAFVYHHCIIINKVGALWDIHCFSFCILFFVGFVSHYFSETTRISSASPRKSSSVSSKSAKNCGYGVVVILVFVFIVVLLIIIYCCCCILMEFRRKKGRNLFSVFLRRFTNKSHRHVTDTVIKVGGTSIPTESEVKIGNTTRTRYIQQLQLVKLLSPSHDKNISNV